MEPNLLFNESPTSHLSASRMGLLCTITLSLLFSMSFVLRRLAGPFCAYSAGEVLQEKIDHIQSHANDYEIFFLGTSRVYRGVDPEIVDSTLKESGCSLRSYNAGVFRLSTLAANRLMDTIVASRDPGNPMLIVVEPSLIDLDLPNLSSEREVGLHGIDETIGAIRLEISSLLQPQAPLDRIRGLVVVFGHLSSGSLHALNYGRFTRLAFPPVEGRSRTYAEPKHNGFLALEDEIQTEGRGWSGPRDSVEQQFRRMQSEGSQERKSWTKPPRPSAIMYYESLANQVEASGGEIAFVCTPRFTVGSYFAGDDIESLLKFPPPYLSKTLLADYRLDSGQAIPGIFDIVFWYDREHLNGSGAEVLSNRIADDLLSKRHLAIRTLQEHLNN